MLAIYIATGEIVHENLFNECRLSRTYRLIQGHHRDEQEDQRLHGPLNNGPEATHLQFHFVIRPEKKVLTSGPWQCKLVDS